MKLPGYFQRKKVEIDFNKNRASNIYEVASIPLRHLKTKKHQRKKIDKVVLGVKIKVLVKEENKNIEIYHLRILDGGKTDLSAGVISASDRLAKVLLGRPLNRLHYLPFRAETSSRIYLTLAKPS